MNSKRYNNIKIGVSIGKGVISFIIILLFVYLGYSKLTEEFIRTYIENDYIVFILFVMLTGFAGSILFFPVNFYIGFYLEHKYNLSNQTFVKWIWENLKGVLISGIIGVPLLLFFYYVLNSYGSMWWLPFAVILFLLSVVLARIAPIIILPLFYKITPLENENLKLKIRELAADAGIKLQEVFRFNMSNNTKKANAAFTGIGKSKRILLGDTLLDNYTEDQIETVIAHELGHYKYKHIIKNIILGTVTSFLTLYLLSILYSISIGWFGFSSITQVSAIPLLSIWAMLIGIIQTPLTSMLSRKYEYEADKYAIVSTGKSEAFKETLEKLNNQNMGDKDPHPFIEWFFYSHPSIKRRITAIDNIKLEHHKGI